MNTIITPDNTSGTPLSVLGIESAPVEVKLRMTPEEIREFVAKARARDAEAKEVRNMAKCAENGCVELHK